MTTLYSGISLVVSIINLRCWFTSRA